MTLNGAIISNVQPGISGTVEAGVMQKGHVSIGAGSRVRPNSYITGPVIIGEGCEIGPGACIKPATSIADNVVVSPLTVIKNSVIGDDVHIGAGSIIEDSVIDKGSIIGGRFTACSGEAEVKIDTEHHTVKTGVMIGEGCNLADSITAQPGVIIGNYCQVRSLKLLGGWFPDQSVVV
ncbi:DapH/DapD/GlmU-related protein [Chloroflexota bacterium]